MSYSAFSVVGILALVITLQPCWAWAQEKLWRARLYVCILLSSGYVLARLAEKGTVSSTDLVAGIPVAIVLALIVVQLLYWFRCIKRPHSRRK